MTSYVTRVLEYFFSLSIRFQPFDPDRDSITFISGKAPATRKGLLVTMGIFMSLAIVGMVAEVVFRKARKAKVQNGEGTFSEIFFTLFYSGTPSVSRYRKKMFVMVGSSL